MMWVKHVVSYSEVVTSMWWWLKHVVAEVQYAVSTICVGYMVNYICGCLRCAADIAAERCGG